MSKKCPKCGKSSDIIQFYGQFCKSCMENDLLKDLPSSAEILICKHCGKIRLQGRFVNDTGRNIQDILQTLFKNYEIKLIDYDPEAASANVYFIKSINGHDLSVEKKLDLIYKKTLCENCNRRAGSYYEAVMQLRGNHERMERFIERVGRYFEIRGEFIAKVKEADNGFDVYLSSKKLAASFISSHHLESTNSYTLYGMKNGKKVFRHTHSIRL